MGSYHQLYRLDGRLIAFSVLDLLPHCVSGVYAIYHSDFEKWSFGKLSALREAALAVEGGYQWYYMGYYIHDCVKMRYKGDYKPQMVLEPESYEWMPLDGEFRNALDKRKYVNRDIARRLSQEIRKQRSADGEEPPPQGTNGAEAGELSRLNRDGKSPQDKDSAEEGEQSEDELYAIPEPEDAADSGLSLLELAMPGVLTADELEDQIDLDHMKIKIGNREVVTMVSELTQLPY